MDPSERHRTGLDPLVGIHPKVAGRLCDRSAWPGVGSGKRSKNVLDWITFYANYEKDAQHYGGGQVIDKGTKTGCFAFMNGVIYIYLHHRPLWFFSSSSPSTTTTKTRNNRSSAIESVFSIKIMINGHSCNFTYPQLLRHLRHPG